MARFSILPSPDGPLVAGLVAIRTEYQVPALFRSMTSPPPPQPLGGFRPTTSIELTVSLPSRPPDLELT